MFWSTCLQLLKWGTCQQTPEFHLIKSKAKWNYCWWRPRWKPLWWNAGVISNCIDRNFLKCIVDYKNKLLLFMFFWKQFKDQVVIFFSLGACLEMLCQYVCLYQFISSAFSVETRLCLCERVVCLPRVLDTSFNLQKTEVSACAITVNDKGISKSRWHS